MAHDRTAGYVTEIEYSSGFHAELGPVLIAFAVRTSGITPPDTNAPFTYMELGCGQGPSTALHACAMPHGRFFAIDLNPAHVLNARRFAEAAGIGNVTYLEGSFAELLDTDLPEFDFITLQGVWSWISPDNRRHIVEFIRQRLKPGGLVYLSYNCLPGWAAAAPLRRLMIDHAARRDGPLPARIQDAVSFAGRLNVAGARYFDRNPSAASRLEQMSKATLPYLAHEYFNRDWTPFYFGDVAAELAEAGLTFAGSANIAEQLDDLTIPPAARNVHAEVSEPIFREMLKDFITGRQFRRDVFASPGKRPAGRPRLALIVPRQTCSLRIAVPAGDITLDEATYTPLLDALAAEPRALDDLPPGPPQRPWSRPAMPPRRSAPRP